MHKPLRLESAKLINLQIRWQHRPGSGHNVDDDVRSILRKFGDEVVEVQEMLVGVVTRADGKF